MHKIAPKLISNFSNSVWKRGGEIYGSKPRAHEAAHNDQGIIFRRCCGQPKAQRYLVPTLEAFPALAICAAFAPEELNNLVATAWMSKTSETVETISR